MSIDAQDFLKIARPALASGDASELACVVSCRWTPKQIASLLSDTHVEVRRLAAVALGLVGDRAVACTLAQALHDSNKEVAQMAEHGLWTIWFRDGIPEAHRPFEEGLERMSTHEHRQAIQLFQEASRIDPDFAEAANQCALARYMSDDWEPAVADCRRAVQRMPCHFGAMACMGHCFAQLNELRKALKCYQAAIGIHPYLLGVRSAIERLEPCLGNLNDHSGQYDAMSIL